MLYRIVKMSGTYYGREVESFIDDEEEIEALEEFARQGEIVLITDDIETLEDEFNIKVELVE